MKLYKLDPSPPARAVMMLCDVLGLAPEMVDVNLLAKEHLKEEFTKLNPVHTIPVLEDSDIVLHDSHAILMYLQDTYGKADSLYPKDVKKRALVNQKLFFNNSVLFPRIRNITTLILWEGKMDPTERQLNDIDEAYSFLEQFLSRTKYLAGNDLTIADIAAIPTVTSLLHLLPLDGKKYPKTQAWINQLEEQSFCQKWNKPGNVAFGEFVTNYRKK